MIGRLLLSRKLGVVATLGLFGGAVITACSSSGDNSGDPATVSSNESRAATSLSGTIFDNFSPSKSALQVIREVSAHNSQLTERFLPQPEVKLRQHGDRLIPKLVEGSPAADLQVNLGANAKGRLVLNPVANPDQAIALTPLLARDVPGQVQADGRVIYPNAYTNTDLIMTANHNRVAVTLVLHTVDAPADFRWQLERAPGLKVVESSRNETSLVDADGHLRLTLREATITSADGVVTRAPLALRDDGTTSLDVDTFTLAYPAVVQFEIDAPPVALAIIPPEIIKARMMVLVDTSGSMMWGFDNGSNQGGDSDDTAVFCDNEIGTGFTCSANVACSLTGATPGLNLFPATDPTNSPSRMLGTKLALQNVFNAHSGLIDFGLMRFREHDDYCIGADAYCCPTAFGATVGGRCTEGQNAYNGPTIVRLDGCVTDSSGANGGCDVSCNTNADGNGNDACNCSNDDQCDGNGGSISNNDNDCEGGICMVTMNNAITYAGQTPGQCSASVGAGGRVLVQPNTGSAPQVRQWVDFVEDFCSSTGSAGGAPRNPELRADGYTPLAYSIDTARTDWYQLAYNAWNTNNTGAALYDSKFDCRPYVLVTMTDGEDTCAADPTTEPPAAVTALRNVSPVNPITIYTMGMGDTGGLDTGVLNAMMSNGGSGRTTAPIAANQTQIEAAFADIVAETVKFEVCNAQDDNCNGRIDEGLNVYQECAVNGDCGSSDCDAGRCGCTADSQCASGYTCAADSFCRPACSVGVGVCRNSGVRKCGSTGGQCCLDDGSDVCTPLSPKPEGTEVCNRIDDDCDGLIDEDFPDGCTICVPRPEVCNGVDDDCDGQADEPDDIVGIGQPCGTNEGVCTAGTITCVNGEPVCENEGAGDDEVCNGLDDDCDGQTDGQTQACYTGPDGTEDVGVCHGGTQVCVAPAGQPGVPCSGSNCWGSCIGEVTPSPEICDGLNNDCDDETDEGVPVVVQTCTDSTECEGNNNCVSGACRCATGGQCSTGHVCGGGNICYEEGTVTGDACCDENFGGKCGTGVCQFGEWTCAGNQVSCIGSTGPSDEICDGLDNDCDGMVDEDLPGVGTSCQADDGECGGELQCVVDYDDDDNPIGGAIVCVPTEGGTDEVCDGKDNDCDGMIDEAPDIFDNDTTDSLGEECDAPPAGNDMGICKAGTYECIDGQIICQGAIKPGTEVCNGRDDDCDGQADEETCEPDGRCIGGECRFPCRSGEFPCDSGETCQKGYCVPDDEADSNNTSTGSGGSNGSGSGAGGSSSGGSNASGSGGSSNGGSSNGGSSNGGGNGGSGNDTGSNADSTNSSTTDSGNQPTRIYGLASGGGGCACRMGDRRVPGEFSLLLGLVGMVGLVRRRRLGRAGL